MQNRRKRKPRHERQRLKAQIAVVCVSAVLITAAFIYFLLLSDRPTP